jgi:glucokinase
VDSAQRSDIILRMNLGGIDIGGSKIGIALGDDQGRVLASEQFPTDPAASPVAVLQEALERLRALGEPPVALGVACPGPLSYREGRMLEVPNMPRWQGFELGRFLVEHAGVPAAFMNDANASVLAEHYWGAASDVESAIFLTMSTGMGAGLLLDGRVYEGSLALAGEVGHLRLREDGPVGFGKRGSVEGYLSGPGMVQVARAELLAFEQAGRSSTLEPMQLTPERICCAAREGDRAAIAVLDRCGHELGRLCAWLVDLLNPDALILGTIGTAHLDLFEPRLRAVLEAEALPAAAAHVQVRGSGLEQRGHQTALAVACRTQRGS